MTIVYLWALGRGTAILRPLLPPAFSLPRPQGMLKVLKWIGIALASLIGLVCAAVLVLNVVGRRKANRAPEMAFTPVTITAGDSTMVARGRHLADFMGCVDCHGPGLSGKPFP